MRIRQKQTYGLSLQTSSLIVPDGSTERLLNVLHQREGLFIKERGFKTLYTPGSTVYGVFEFDEYIVIITNSQVTRIDKFGVVQSTASSSSAFEIDGTGRPAPYAFTGAPFSVVMNDQAFFCTPEGIRVIRQSSSSTNILPGLNAPIIENSANLTTGLANFRIGEGTIVAQTTLTPTDISSLAFYQNDLVLTASQSNASPIQNYDVAADTAISYKAVLRRVLPNGQTIESPPSQPVFAFNPVIKEVAWATNNGGGAAANEIFLVFSYRIAAAGAGTLKFAVNQTFTGVIVDTVSYRLQSGATQEVVDSPEINGRYTFTVTTTAKTTIGAFDYENLILKVTLPTIPRVDSSFVPSAPYGESLGTCSFQFDRYSTISINVPSSAQTGDYIDLYYSQTEIPLSSNSLAIPDGDYYLAKEIEITGSGIPGWLLNTNLATGIFQKGPPLYTNPSDGDLSRLPNIVPPGANCIEQWKGHLFFGNTYRRHQVDLTHIGGILTTNRTFSIQFTDSGTPENYTFQFIKSLADAATIKKRVQELANDITYNSSNFLCYYSDSTVEFPGGLTIISRVPNRGFKVFCNNADLGAAMEPNLGTTFAATEVVSTQEAKKNRIYWSKQNQPEAVPFFIDIGDENEDILNIQRTRDSLIVIKRDGIFSLFGNPASGILSVREIDTTVKGVSATGVTKLGNRVFAKTNQGIVAISESGMVLASRQQIEPLVKVSEENTTGDTVMYALEDDRQLYVATATSPADSTKIVYSYNTLTQSWSEISKVFTWGFVVDNNFTVSKMFQNNRVITDGTSVFIERKDNELTDWADQEFSRTVSSISADKLQLTLSSAFSGPVGSALVWNNGTEDKIYRITAVNGTVVTLNIPFSGVATNPVTLYTPIQSIIRTSPIDGGDSSIVKQFTKFVMNLRYDAFSACTLTFRSDWQEYGSEVDWTKRDERRGWGQEQWGRFPWGQATARDLQYLTKPSQIVQTEVPRNQQKTTFLQAEIDHNVACEGMFIQQMAFELDTKSMRPAR